MSWQSRESVSQLAVLINISTISISSYLFHSKQHIIFDLFKVLVKFSCLNTEQCKFASSEYRYCLNVNVRIMSTDLFSRSKFMTSSNWNNLKIKYDSCNWTCRHGNEIPIECATYPQLLNTFEAIVPTSLVSGSFFIIQFVSLLSRSVI